MGIAIVDYGMGNLKSVYKAFYSLGLEAEITSSPERVLKAEKVVLPGVGAFRDAISELNRTGLGEAVCEVAQKGTPLLGICLGMQLLFNKSYEYGEYEGLKLLPGEIVKFKPENMVDEAGVSLKVPHMGWNNLNFLKNAPLFEGLKEGDSVYFVHSYYLETMADVVSATTDYGTTIAVAAQKDNIFATQFHPEKSGTVGLHILKNFGGL
ncbi:imidazole glycerol phosphate synthase subunit HisH [Sporanaerobium hydrogeniformans]|uniref:Imidazole glycerol phosphate synthase subunit HisH n=1 Tax=Sporanaerobium hydrogeniformans TaxID=3072179 RepID=A0AC61DCI3_9FIRM|nr:imidazole glycerol phosphate synthase subunit HisH [Sporanaerobium hydrogeniformans]PHV71019.1 imidazole glycerol phosphate synthase subunit HisH [Sporanaerobium hydrogeniformans]